MKDQEETEAKQEHGSGHLEPADRRRNRLAWAQVIASTVDAVARFADLAARMVR